MNDRLIDMKESNNENLGYNFIKTGFRDYEAGRFLLNNCIFMPGVTLASSAVEKYLKAVLITHNIKRKIHLDNLKEIKKAFNRVNIDLINELDEVFLEILSDAYKLRYYDNLNDSLSLGFLSNQLIGELDYTINLIESRLNFQNNSTGKIVSSPYQIAVNSKNEKVYQNNYVLNNQGKKEFMEKKSTMYTLHVEKNGFEIETTGEDLKVQEYTGKMLRVSNVTIE